MRKHFLLILESETLYITRIVTQKCLVYFPAVNLFASESFYETVHFWKGVFRESHICMILNLSDKGSLGYKCK